MDPSSPLHYMKQRIISSKVGLILEAKLITKQSQAAEKVLVDMLDAEYAAASDIPKDASF